MALLTDHAFYLLRELLLRIISRRRACGYEVSSRLDGAPRARSAGSPGPLSSGRGGRPVLASSTRARNSTASFPCPSFAPCAATCMATERDRSSSPWMCALSSALICSALAIGAGIVARLAQTRKTSVTSLPTAVSDVTTRGHTHAISSRRGRTAIASMASSEEQVTVPTSPGIEDTRIRRAETDSRAGESRPVTLSRDMAKFVNT